MRTILIAVLGAATIALGSGCSLVAPSDIQVSQSLPKAAQEVQKAINESNVLIIASANVLAQNLKDGVMLKAEVDGYAVKLRQMAAQVDKAQDLLRLGDIASSRTQAELIQKAITALHKEVAARARKQ
jgi:soluble cytochrome b562